MDSAMPGLVLLFIILIVLGVINIIVKDKKDAEKEPGDNESKSVVNKQEKNTGSRGAMNSMIHEMGFLTEETVICSEEEIKRYEGISKDALPYNVSVVGGRYVKRITKYPTPEELEKLCMLRQTKSLDTIRKCVKFLAGVTAVGLGGGLLCMLYLLDPSPGGMELALGIVLILGIVAFIVVQKEKKDRFK